MHPESSRITHFIKLLIALSMKVFSKLVLALLMFGLSTTSKIKGQTFQQNQIQVNAGINLGTLGLYRGATGIPIIGSLEYGIQDIIGVGPYVGYVSYTYNNGFGKYGWRFFEGGARVDFHGWKLLEEATESNLGSDKVDVYLAGLLGFRTGNYFSNDGITNGFQTFSNGVRVSFLLGGRYYFTDNIAVYAEVGRVLFGALSVGATIKIK